MNKVNLELYRIFLAVVAEGSFTSAARKLFISQPAVSQSIRQLEGQLGTRLFIRNVKGAALTAEGELLRQHAEAAIALLEAGEYKLDRLRRLQLGELRIGASDTVARHLLLPMLEAFVAQYPDISLGVQNGTSSELLHCLRQGRVDLAFLSMPYETEGLTVRPCLHVHDSFVAGPRYAQLGTLTPERLAGVPLIMLERQSNSRRCVDAALLEMGVSVAPEIELGAHDLLLDFAKIGLGVSCVVREFASEALAEGTLVELPLEPPLPRRYIAAVHLNEIPLPAPARTFLSMLLPPDTAG
ncbi:MAG: LysR family transcriptional regulator [Clostridiales bacterium]|nr:LysR family transcriptional regulator [Clostridiales bacterium]